LGHVMLSNSISLADAALGINQNRKLSRKNNYDNFSEFLLWLIN